MIFEYSLFFIVGIVIGSFLNVCIYRIPRNKSVIYPPSSCTTCGRKLQWFEMFPIVSFLALGKRCRGCKEKLSWRYPLVEFLTGLSFIAAYYKWDISIETLKACIFISLIIPISFIDLDFKIIPNKLSYLGIILGLGLNFKNYIDSSIGVLLGFVIIGLIIVLSRGGMGWGDAKLMAMFGAFWGWRIVLYSLFIGSLLGSIIGAVLLALKKIDRRTPIPFGPHLCFGAVISLYFQEIFNMMILIP